VININAGINIFPAFLKALKKFLKGLPIHSNSKIIKNNLMALAPFKYLSVEISF
jgi:hypothetical protein